MRVRLLTALLAATLFAAACQGVQPTLLVMEVTREVPVTVIVTSAPTSGPLMLTPATPTPTPPGTPFVSPTPSATPTPDPFPTPVVGQIFIADQLFERGRMFWLQPADQIWVVTTAADGTRQWQVFNDTFEEGMLERDPTFVAPTGQNRMQPERGFGKLWRENAALRAEVGWAIGEELGYSTRYEYHAGGTVDPSGVFIQASGYHLLQTLDDEVFLFYEGSRTWEVRPAD